MGAYLLKDILVIDGLKNSSKMKDLLRLIAFQLGNERIKANYNEGLGKEFYFWRTYDNQEIDLIEEKSDSLAALEFKWGKKKPNVPSAFKEAYPNATFDVVNKDNYLNYM